MTCVHFFNYLPSADDINIFGPLQLNMTAPYFKRILTPYVAGAQQTTRRLMLMKLVLFPLL
jgi:hypothetical protein